MNDIKSILEMPVSSIYSYMFQIPDEILTDEHFVKKIANIKSASFYRYIINKISKRVEVEKIEQLRKKVYDDWIQVDDNKIISMLVPLYNKINECIELGEHNITDFVYDFFEGTSVKINKFIDYIKNYWDKTSLLKIFQYISCEFLDDFIIDYHFEELYYNLMINIKNMCDFCSSQTKDILAKDKLEFYLEILSLKSLSLEDKLSLHEKLKLRKPIEEFYDDYRFVKDYANKLLIDSCINEDCINKNKNSELTNKLGVDVYYLDGEPFYAMVKTFYFSKNESLPENYFDDRFRSKMASFSVIGNEMLRTYKSPKESYAIIYSNFNVDQIVHVASHDSWSNVVQHPDKNNCSDYIYEILSPEQLASNRDEYNEIVYLQNDTSENPNEELIDAKPIAICCFDEITEKDIISAKRNNLAIVLINTTRYVGKEPSNAIFTKYDLAPVEFIEINDEQLSNQLK